MNYNQIGFQPDKKHIHRKFSVMLIQIDNPGQDNLLCGLSKRNPENILNKLLYFLP